MSTIFSEFIRFIISSIVAALPEAVRRVFRDLMIASFIAFIVWVILVNANLFHTQHAADSESINSFLGFVFVFLLSFIGLLYLERAIDKRSIREQFMIVGGRILNGELDTALEMLAAIKDPKARQWEAEIKHGAPYNPDFLREIEQH